MMVAIWGETKSSLLLIKNKEVVRQATKQAPSRQALLILFRTFRVLVSGIMTQTTSRRGTNAAS